MAELIREKIKTGDVIVFVHYLRYLSVYGNIRGLVSSKHFFNSSSIKNGVKSNFAVFVVIV